MSNNSNKSKPVDKIQVRTTEEKIKALKKLPSYRGEVKRTSEINKLPEVKVGEIFWIAELDMAHIVTKDKNQKGHYQTEPLDTNATISMGVSIYEFNKSLVAQESLFDWADLDNLHQTNNLLSNWLESTKNKTYLLYGKTLSYFTFINKTSEGYNLDTLHTLKDLLKPIGELVSLESNPDGKTAIELWVKTSKDNAEVLYLLPADRLTIEI